MAYKKIDPDVKTQWLAALRSGRFSQSFGALRKGSGVDSEYCCLGVLCNLESRHRWHDGGGFYRYGAQSDIDIEGNQVCDAMPPKDLAEKINLSKAAASALAEMNDSGSSFEEIADWIEKNL